MKLKYVLILIVLCSCQSAQSEFGAVSVLYCPSCPEAFSGFETCAFYEVDPAWAREQMIVDADHFVGVGFPVRVAGYMHHKFCFNATHASFGSANPTSAGLFVSDNFVFIVESSTLAQNFAHEYAFLLGNTSPPFTRQFMFNNAPVEHVFCPRHGCEDMLVSYIQGAEHDIVFLAFSFTSKPVGESLIAAHLRGVRVRGVFESWGAGSQYSQYAPLKDAGIEVHLAPRKVGGVMHHKAFVVDNTAIVGSFNPSANANTRNAETLIALREPVIVSAIHEEFLRLRT